MIYPRSRTDAAAPVLALTLAIWIQACATASDDTTPPPPPPPTRTAAQASPSGNGQTGVVQTALSNPIRVLVTDNGSPEAGVTVTWSGSGTGAAFTPATSTTGADGIAETTWTLPQQAGSATASATVTGAGGSPVSFSAAAQPEAPDQVTLRDGDDQIGGVGEVADAPMRVTVADQYGNGIVGETVTWMVVTGDATLSAASTTTAGGGIAGATLTYGPTSGPITVTATAGALGSVTFTALSGHIVTILATNTFSPASLTIDAGEYVIWQWSTNAISHTVTPDPPGTEPPPSGLRSYPTADPYPHQFNTPGTYNYHCEVHGTPGVGMFGSITVQ